MKEIIWIIVIICMTSLVMADFGFSNSNLPKIDTPEPDAVTFDNNTGSVNSSDFWDLLDDPGDMFYSTFGVGFWDSNVDLGVYNISASYILGSTITPTLPNDLVNKDYVDDVASAIAFDFFFTNHTSDITGHYNLTESDEGHVESALTSISLGTGSHNIGNFTTQIGQPEFNELRKGVYDVRLHLFKTGTKSVTITPKLYNMSTDGLSKNLLMTFETSIELTGVDATYDLHGTLNEQVILSEGDRLHMEFMAEVGSSGSNPTVTLDMEGTTDTHLSIETSSNAFEQIFLRQDGTKSLTGNWNYGSSNINGSGNITTESINTRRIIERDASDFGIFIQSDFVNTGIYNNQPWLSGNIVGVGGQRLGNSGLVNHPGRILLASSTVAGSGYGYFTSTSAYVLGGGETTTFIFMPKGHATTKVKMGFHDNFNKSFPVDGAWININNTNATGYTSDAGTRTTTTTGFTVVTDAWYKFKVTVNSDATEVDYRIYSEAGALLWNSTITTNIPVGALGHGIVATSTGTTARYVGQIDYMDMYTDREMIR